MLIAVSIGGLGHPVGAESATLDKLLASSVPDAVLLRIDVPVLFLFGSEDPNQPTRASVARIEQTMVPEGLDVTVRVFEGAGHGLTETGGALRADVRRALTEFLRRVL